MPKRIHVLKAKRGQLRAGWGRVGKGQNPDLCYAWGAGGAESPDARLICSAFEDAKTSSGLPLREELEARGYDITTLKFSIEQKSSEPSGG